MTTESKSEKEPLPPQPPPYPETQQEKEAVWADAYLKWLAGKGSPHTIRGYHNAWKQLRAFTGKAYWEIDTADIAEWRWHLEDRGLVQTSIQSYLGAVSSFFRFACNTYMTRDANGSLKPLHHTNPVRVIHQGYVQPFANAHYLSGEQVRAFLQAIPQDTVWGLRDYAFFAMLITTGRRSVEVRELRLGDFDVYDELAYYRWEFKGEERQSACHIAVWNAIERWLVASERLEKMDGEDFIFTGFWERKHRSPRGTVAFRTRRPPLSIKRAHQLVKMYAARAGLDASMVNLPCLRHTAAMLRKDAGAGMEELFQMLDRHERWATRDYFRRIQGHADVEWVEE